MNNLIKFVSITIVAFFFVANTAIAQDTLEKVEKPCKMEKTEDMKDCCKGKDKEAMKDCPKMKEHSKADHQKMMKEHGDMKGHEKMMEHGKEAACCKDKEMKDGKDKMMNHDKMMKEHGENMDHKNMDHSKMESSIVHKGVIDVASIDKNGDGKVFQDPMDWNVIADEAGSCPLCGMKLREVSIDDAKKNLEKNGFEVK